MVQNKNTYLSFKNQKYQHPRHCTTNLKEKAKALQSSVDTAQVTDFHTRKGTIPYYFRKVDKAKSVGTSATDVVKNSFFRA